MKQHCYGNAKLFLVLALFTIFCISIHGVVEFKGSSPVPTIIFPHKPHIEQELECSDCHEHLEKSSILAARHLPKESVCVDCHEKGESKEDCAICHVVPEKPETYPLKTWDIHFSHTLHLEKNIQCMKCHISADTAMEVQELYSMKMAVCMECHKPNFNTGSCTDCHKNIRNITPPDHQGNWIKRHKSNARTGLKKCSQCHHPDFCIRCHFGKPKMSHKDPDKISHRFIHSGDWVTRHTGAARRESNTCFSCHKIESCNDCHNSFGKDVSYQVGIHPSGWLDPGSKQFHGKKARINPVTCAACHETESKNSDPVCLDCHGRDGLNPHPKNWKDHFSGKNPLIHGDGDMCFRCHDRKGDKKLCRKCHPE